MNSQWIKDIAVGALPEPFDQLSHAMTCDLIRFLPIERPNDRKAQKARAELAVQLAHVCMLSLLVECEGEEIYFPILDGDKLCDLRRGLIRKKFRELKGKRRDIYKALRSEFGGSDRSIRTAVKLDDEKQGEMFEKE